MTDSDTQRQQRAAAAMFPGTYERNTLTHRQSGSMGGSAYGTDLPPGPTSMAPATIAEQTKAGGGKAK